MINIRNISIVIFLVAIVVSCNTEDKKDNKKVAEKETQAIPDSLLVDVDLRVNGAFYSITIPKGAYIDDQHGIYAYVYLEPGDENRLIISPDNSDNSGLQENKNGFQYFGEGVACMYATDTMDLAAKKFVQIAESIKPKSAD